MTLHKYLWAMLTEKGSSSLNLDACLSGFSLSNFLRLVGIVSMPEEFLEADYNSETKICELPTSYQELFVNKNNINETMVKSGFAWVYDRYVKSPLLYSYQDEAKSKNLGIWQSENPIAPWVWRRKK